MYLSKNEVLSLKWSILIYKVAERRRQKFADRPAKVDFPDIKVQFRYFRGVHWLQRCNFQNLALPDYCKELFIVQVGLKTGSNYGWNYLLP